MFRYFNGIHIYFIISERVLNFLLYCLNQRGLGSAASGALLSICTACPLHMTTHFSGLLQIARSLDNFAISNDAAIGLLKGGIKFYTLYYKVYAITEYIIHDLIIY